MDDSGKKNFCVEVMRDGLMTIGEACEFLSVSRSFVYQLLDTGQLPFVKMGKSRRIPKRALTQYAAGNLQGGMELRK